MTPGGIRNHNFVVLTAVPLPRTESAGARETRPTRDVIGFDRKPAFPAFAGSPIQAPAHRDFRSGKAVGIRSVR
jgi:hypothetical protein